MPDDSEQECYNHSIDFLIGPGYNYLREKQGRDQQAAILWFFLIYPDHHLYGNIGWEGDPRGCVP